MSGDIKLYKINNQEIEKLVKDCQILWHKDEVTFLPENIVGKHEHAHSGDENDLRPQYNTSLIRVENLPERFLPYMREVSGEYE